MKTRKEILIQNDVDQGAGRGDGADSSIIESVSCSVVSDSFAIPWTVVCQVLLSMGFPRQEYWSGLPFLPDPEIEPRLLLGRRILYQ